MSQPTGGKTSLSPASGMGLGAPEPSTLVLATNGEQLQPMFHPTPRKCAGPHRGGDYPHLTDEDAEVQKGKAPLPTSHS